MISTGTLAKILNVSHAAILQRYKKNNKSISSHSKVVNHRRYYDGKAVAIMIKSLKLNKYHRIGENSSSKDLRIENKRQAKDIEDLHKLLNQSQILASRQQQIANQSQKRLKLASAKQQHGFIWRLFH